MKILYFTQQEANESYGIYKKICYQVEALKKLGNKVDLISNQTKGKKNFKILEKNNGTKEIIEENSLRGISLMRYVRYNKVYELIEKEKYDLVYIRYAQAAMPFFNKFLKKIKERTGSKIILEIPTYPYDGENLNVSFLKKIKVILEKLYRNKMKNYIDKIVTFSEDKYIYGIKCINISNGINFDTIRKIEEKNKLKEKQIIFTVVATIRFWHGIDRFLNSLFLYKKKVKNENIKFYIVGEGSEISKLKKIVKNNVEYQRDIIFCGNKSGKDLDEIYDKTDIAVGSLGIHRIKGLESVQPLKNREYCAKGLPFIIGFNDIEFKNKEYVYNVSFDEKLIDIEDIINWYRNLKISSEEIRKDAKKFAWDIQMKKVLDNI